MDVDAWNGLVFADVCARGRPGRLLYLYVDRELLGRLSGLTPEDAVADFGNAMQTTGRRPPFAAAATAALRWKMNGFAGPPVFVAHLAMTVLAVTEEPLGRPHGLYRLQNRLLGLPATPTEPAGYGSDVPTMWSVWNAWLGGPGACYGRPSARTHPHWTRQGWARSQGLIRYADRERIEQFLAVKARQDLRTPAATEFVEWLRYRGAWGADLVERLNDEAALEIVQDVLDDEALRWLHHGPRPVGRGNRGLLQYDDWTGTFSGAVTVDESLHGVALDIGEDELYTAGPFEDSVLVRLAASPEVVLGSGVSHRITQDITMSFGGGDVYVMAEEPSVAGRLQCRRLKRPSVFSILVHGSRRDAIAAALRGAGLPHAANPSPVAGWFWFEKVFLEPGSALLSLLGLAATPTGGSDGLALEGGFKVAPGTYLTGGEPDVVLDSSVQVPAVTLDGTPVPVAAGETRVSMATLCPDPGEHRVASPAGERRFRTVAYQLSQARSGDLWSKVEPSAGGYRFEPAGRGRPTSPLTASGAALEGISIPSPLAIRRPGNAECIVVTEAGAVRQVWPATPAWLRAIGLAPATVDVMQSLRTMQPRPAFFIVRSLGARHLKHAVAIPSGLPLVPGHVPSRPCPELVSDLVASRWSGPENPQLRLLLSKAIQYGHGSHGDSEPHQRPVAERGDVLQSRRSDNPFDDVLTWLSEREHGRASQANYAETWAWTCARSGYHQLAGEWRLSLRALTRLGHVERDFARREVAVAPAVLTALPAAAGLYLLTGARPTRLLERMDDPDDADSVVAAAAGAWVMHFRTPLDNDGRPSGPSTVYVECDVDHLDTIRQGLRQLGVTLQGTVAVQLLDMLPSLPQAVASAQPLHMSPSKQPLLRAPTATGAWAWVPRTDDTRQGLYCYHLRGQKAFAWRGALDGGLVAIAPDLGEWLARHSHGQTTLLAHDPIAKRLLVRGGIQLPALLTRALCLRTGLPPREVAPSGSHRNQSRLAFENVDEASASQVARLLQQNLQHAHDTMG